MVHEIFNNSYYFQDDPRISKFVLDLTNLLSAISRKYFLFTSDNSQRTSNIIKIRPLTKCQTHYVKGPGTAFIDTKPILVYTNEL